MQIDPEIHGQGLAKAVEIVRKVAVSVVGVGLAAAAGIQLLPIYGVALGALATVAAATSGVAATLLLFPRVVHRKVASSLARQTAEERSIMTVLLEASIGSMGDSEVRAVLRYCSQKLLELADKAPNDVETQQFVLINMQSLISISQAFVIAEKQDVASIAILGRRVLETVSLIQKATGDKARAIAASAARPLDVELTVSNRIVEEQRI